MIQINKVKLTKMDVTFLTKSKEELFSIINERKQDTASFTLDEIKCPFGGKSIPESDLMEKINKYKEFYSNLGLKSKGWRLKSGSQFQITFEFE